MNKALNREEKKKRPPPCSIKKRKKAYGTIPMSRVRVKNGVLKKWLSSYRVNSSVWTYNEDYISKSKIVFFTIPFLCMVWHKVIDKWAQSETKQ